MSKLNFTKMNGAGNDFILIDKTKNTKLKLSKEFIEQICNRHKGIGADGVLVVKPNNNYRFKLDYYNSDGSTGTLCGNGARCAIKYILDNYKVKKNKIKFFFNNEVYKGYVGNNENITFVLNVTDNVQQNLQIEINGSIILGDFINTGSPHVVINWDDIKSIIKDDFNSFNVKDFGRQIRFAKLFEPNGTNVNFIKLTKQKNYIRTYERGVEDETLACGTGVVAASIVALEIFKRKLPIDFYTYGGDTLTVDCKKIKQKKRKISLTGPAKINYIGTYNY